MRLVFFVIKGPQFLHCCWQLSWRSPGFLKITADENTNSKNNLLSASGQDHWNSTEHVMVGTPGHQGTTEGMKPAEVAPQAEFLSMKALLSRDFTFTSGSPDISFKIKSLNCTFVQKTHKELCQDFSKKNCLGTAGRISCWFESLWRHHNLTDELFNQPCSTEHILNPCLLS